jgi:uncharacterized protein YbjT (DUF2867 family)
MDTTIADNKILVLGGTGHYGRWIVRSLIKMGENVRVLSRNTKNARKILGNNLEIIEGDITSRDAIIESLLDIKSIVISISAFSRKTIKKIKVIEQESVLMVLNEAKKNNISRIVYISTYDLDRNLIQKFNILEGKIKLVIEDFLMKSDFNWTVIGAAPSMELFFTLIRKNKMSVPGGGPPALPCLSPIDLGIIVAEAAIRFDLSSKRFRATGPEAYSFPQAAERISDITGMNISFRKIPLFPITIASIISRPFTPYIWHLRKFLGLLNNFPQDIANEVPKDHSLLINTFNYKPTTLEMHAILWKEEFYKKEEKD